MAGALTSRSLTPHSSRHALDRGWWVPGLTLVALGYLGLMVLAPLGVVFASALKQGLGPYYEALTEPDAISAMTLSLWVACLSVAANLVFGVAAAWLLSKYRFAGRSLLITLIDLPFSVSPVVAGLVFVLVFGSRGWFGPWLMAHGVKVIFAWPAILLATCFVTFPIIVRELLTLMEAQGSSEEEAALLLGASGFTIFLKVTLPKIRWALVHGVVLCSARALGEFGAVSVVSGHIRGETNTLPLHVEVLYDDYQFVGAFAAASLLTLVGLGALVFKRLVEWQQQRQLAAATAQFAEDEKESVS
jgi:sulfate transport system permease protein